MTQIEQENDVTTWSELCTAGDLPEGEPVAITVDGQRLCAIFDGSEYFALDDLCNHGRAFLSEGYCDTDDCVVECPLHGGLFDYRNGEPAGDPVEKPNRTYPIRVEGDKVMVQL